PARPGCLVGCQGDPHLLSQSADSPAPSHRKGPLVIVLHELDGNFAELTDREAFLARVEAADRLAWAGETGQLGLEHRGPGGTSWLFLSLVADGRYLVYSQ